MASQFETVVGNREWPLSPSAWLLICMPSVEQGHHNMRCAHAVISLVQALWLLFSLDFLTAADSATSESLFAFCDLGMGTAVPPAHSPEQPCKAMQEVCGGMGAANSQ